MRKLDLQPIAPLPSLILTLDWQSVALCPSDAQSVYRARFYKTLHRKYSVEGTEHENVLLRGDMDTAVDKIKTSSGAAGLVLG